jgi:CoA:oxalate CoA-transferase
MIVDVDDPDVGRIRMTGNPIKFSNHTDAATRQPAPNLDADREHIVSSLLDDHQ